MNITPVSAHCQTKNYNPNFGLKLVIKKGAVEAIEKVANHYNASTEIAMKNLTALEQFLAKHANDFNQNTKAILEIGERYSEYFTQKLIFNYFPEYPHELFTQEYDVKEMEVAHYGTKKICAYFNAGPLDFDSFYELNKVFSADNFDYFDKIDGHRTRRFELAFALGRALEEAADKLEAQIPDTKSESASLVHSINALRAKIENNSK